MTKSPLLVALAILVAACSAEAPSSGHESTADAGNSDLDRFAANGIFGQRIEIDPAKNLGDDHE
jgi:hypothetical protein